MKKILTAKAEKNMELYDFLRLVMGLTKNQISRLKFRDPGITVDGIQRRVNWMLTPGEIVCAYLEDGETASGHLVLDPTPVVILYEDEDLIIVNKPSGTATHPGGRHYGDTMANRLMHYFYEQGMSLRIRPIGRLDLETSGALMFAKSGTAAGRMARQREKKILRKEYLALVEGTPEPRTGTICLPLMRDPRNEFRMMPARRSDEQEGWRNQPNSVKAAITHYRVLEEYLEASAVAVTLETGRMHQIRCHMSAIGHPLLGDPLYGTANEHMSRTALHARYLTFEQPFTGECITVEAPIPEDMKVYMQASPKTLT